MPKLHRIGSAQVVMYYGDHAPPHFHVKSHEGDAMIGLESGLPVLKGKIPSQLYREVKDWAAPRMEALEGCWSMAKQNVPVEEWVEKNIKPERVFANKRGQEASVQSAKHAASRPTQQAWSKGALVPELAG